MAYIPLVNGGSQPVFSIDTLNGPLAQTGTYLAGVPAMLQGPKLDFFGIDLGADPSAEAGVNGAIQHVLQAIQVKATVAFYQVAATANPTNFSVAVYPTAAWDAAALQTAIQALGSVGPTPFNLAGATVTNVGFRLASTATAAA